MTRPVVRVRDLHKTFVQSGRFPWSPVTEVQAVRGVDFSVAAGEVIALVGQSGSGKTTVSRMILGLESPTKGEVHIEDLRWDLMSERARKRHRVHYQYVPQDAMGALDPQQTALEHRYAPRIDASIQRFSIGDQKEAAAVQTRCWLRE